MHFIQRRPTHGYIDTHLWVPKQFINVPGTKNALTFAFHSGRDDQKIRFVYLWKEAPHHLLVPRSFWQIGGLPFPVIDCRPQQYERANISSRIKLDHRIIEQDGKVILEPTGRDVQRTSMAALHANPGGILQLACGAGKSVVGLEFIAQMGGPALIIVDNTQLLEHWRVEIEQSLDVPGGIGLVQADVFDWKKSVVLATYHTIGNIAATAPEEFRRWFKTIIWDEGHHISAPTFAPGAELFYGYRLALTATPKRDDGCQVIYELHIGKVIYKNLKQDLNARVAFDWTGLQLDETRPDCQVRDKTKELHLSMLGVYYGCWREHLNHVLRRTWEAVQVGRRVLVLCNSIDEAVNLCAIWNGAPTLYSDIPIPTPMEVDESLHPLERTPAELKRYAVEIKRLEDKLLTHKLTPSQYANTAARKSEIEQWLKQHDVHLKVAKLLRKRQREYLKDLNERINTGGLMIFKIDAKTRQIHLRTKQVVFCFKKYGREGLNNKALDTVISTMPFSSQGTLQQVKGRVERFLANKRSALLLIIEHDIGPIIGMCQKIRSHLKEWPIDEGGPFTYELHNHPYAKPCKTQLFG